MTSPNDAERAEFEEAWMGATAFLSAVQGDGQWADEFLAWYVPSRWLNEQRACAAFLAAKWAAAERDARRYRWVRTAGAWNSEIGMSELSEVPALFDIAIDAEIERSAARSDEADSI